jgi:chemotaxis protein MotB
MPRKKRNEEHENHERWLVSYADFITLLFAFFVVMYSISSVNEGKYRVLSDSIVAAFRDPSRSLRPVQVGDLARVSQQSDSLIDRSQPVIELFRVPLPVLPDQSTDPRHARAELAREDAQSEQIDQASQELADAIEADMMELVDDGLIQVRRDKRWIEVEINTSILFPSGSAQLSAQAQPVLRELAEKLGPLDNIIHVEGFTDNVPISNFEFISNWELSAARAASVVHLFTRLGIDPQRMAAVGYGEYRPVASNDSVEGRAKNRRVVLVIMSGADARVSERLNHLQSTREGELIAPGTGRVLPAPPVAPAASVSTTPEAPL